LSRHLVTPVIIAVLLAGCGSAGTSTAASGNAIPTVQQAAAQMGATGVHPYKPGPFASAYADATWHGESVTIATFATASLEDQWLSLAGTATTVVYKGTLFAAVKNPGGSASTQPHPAPTVTRTVTRTVKVPEPGPTVGVPLACAQQLEQAWANRAPVAASMANVLPQAAPACVPYESELFGT
jgi:hypothetical protein